MDSGDSAHYKTINWLLLFCFLFAAAMVLYAPILQLPFGGTEYMTFFLPLNEHSVLPIDYIVEWSPDAVRKIEFSRPLLKLFLLIEYRIWGHDPVPYRTFCILLHVGCGLAATRVVLLATRRRTLAWVTGLIFTVHPSAVPAVRWVSACGDLTAGFFSILALGAVFRLIISSRQPPALWRALLPALYVFLALTGKELGLANFIALPLVWFLWPGEKRDRRTGVVLFSSLVALCLAYFSWRFFIFGGMGGYGPISDIIEFPRRLGIMLWQTSGAYLISTVGGRVIYLVLLFAVIILLGCRSALRWRRTGVLALLLAVYGFQSIIVWIQDGYYAYVPAAILSILLGTVLVESAAVQPIRTGGVVLLALIPLIGQQVHTTARVNMDRAVEQEVTERLMAAIEEKELLMEDGARFLLRLEGVERDRRIRDQSKIINVFLRHVHGPDGPAIRRNPKKLPPNPPVLVWDGINLSIHPAPGVAGDQTVNK